MADVLEHLATNVKVVDVCRGTVLVLGSRSLEAGLVVLQPYPLPFMACFLTIDSM